MGFDEKRSIRVCGIHAHVVDASEGDCAILDISGKIGAEVGVARIERDVAWMGCQEKYSYEVSKATWHCHLEESPLIAVR